ncbi:hypothetical protein AU197_11570 [Mycobacterium sp. IS-1590]|uniref:hypothetical protein n=1 Tax=Mycobacterium sp. IS-1590 TaxID=1772286 RepID=UPI000746999E|nr:hypothetical protein [Mycobacterium sp. IS-1590]KUI44911.1 hypothetical protein AU197_11570 [Mycobacterium sp. IS-1590]
MKKFLAGLALALTLSIGTTIGAAAPASADELSYLNAMARLGITPNNNVTYTQAQAVVIAANTYLC